MTWQNLQTIELNIEYSDLKNLSVTVNLSIYALNCETHFTSLCEEIELLLSFGDRLSSTMIANQVMEENDPVGGLKIKSL